MITIPNNWEVVYLKDIAEKSTKKNSDLEILDVFSNSAINGIVLQNDFFDKDIAQKDNLDSYYIVENGDFVYNPRISKYAPAGPINRNIKGIRGVVSPLYTVFRISSELNINFFELYFKSNLWIKYICSVANYGARHDRMNISNNDFYKMSIPLPPEAEQEKIVTILTIWNNAIEKQKLLIQEKKQFKKGLMQKFLNGEVRFDGFKDEWKDFKLSDIGSTFNGITGKTADDFGVGNGKYITYKSIFDSNKIDINTVDIVNINSSENQNLVKFGDIFFTVSSETPEEVGMSSVLLDDVENTYLNSFCFGYRLKNFKTLKPHFARFYFRSFYIRDKIMKLAQGSTRFNLSKKEVLKITIKLPSIEEQDKIADVLTNASNEINLLKKELEELKQQKKGLMQNLLTGKVRVKV